MTLSGTTNIVHEPRVKVTRSQNTCTQCNTAPLHTFLFSTTLSCVLFVFRGCIATMLDTKGPEVRSGDLAEPLDMKRGEQYVFTLEVGGTRHHASADP